MSENQTTTAVEKKRPVAVGSQGIVITDMDGMWRWSQYVAASGLAPKGLEKPESIFVATQMGLELGLSPMAALQNIAVINGRPTVWGDSQLGIVRATGELEEFQEWYEVKGQKTNRNPNEFSDDVTAVCRVKRRGYDAQESAFSVGDAKKAGLWGKAGPWSQYPARMLRFRARSFILRDNFGDALRGMLSTEEARDMGPYIDVESVPEKPGKKQLAEPIPTFKPKSEAKPEPKPEAPALTDPAARLVAILEAEGCGFQTLKFVCEDPSEGVSAWNHITRDCVAIDQMKPENIEQLLSKEKNLRTFLRTAKEAGK